VLRVRLGGYLFTIIKHMLVPSRINQTTSVCMTCSSWLNLLFPRSHYTRLILNKWNHLFNFFITIVVGGQVNSHPYAHTISSVKHIPLPHEHLTLTKSVPKLSWWWIINTTHHFFINSLSCSSSHPS